MPRKLLRSLGAVAALVVFASPSEAREEETTRARSLEGDGGTLTVFVENDSFIGRDDNFTNGVGVAWVSDDAASYGSRHPVRRLTRAFSFLPTVGSSGFENFAGFTVGQEMYTPIDTESPAPPPDQQPYAGILFFDTSLYGIGSGSLHDFTLRLGLVGPASGADEAQELIHRWIGAPIPRGWDHQLDNEPLVNLNYQYYRRLVRRTPPGGPHYDLTSRLGGGIGNYFTGGTAGVVARAGYRLPDNYGAASLRTGGAGRFVGLDPPQRGQWHGYLFLGLQAFAVGRFLPTDGNTFEDSPSVRRDDYIANLASGLVVGYGRWLVSLTLNNVAGLTEFRSSTSEDFGTLTVSYHFRGTARRRGHARRRTSVATAGSAGKEPRRIPSLGQRRRARFMARIPSSELPSVARKKP